MTAIVRRSPGDCNRFTTATRGRRMRAMVGASVPVPRALLYDERYLKIGKPLDGLGVVIGHAADWISLHSLAVAVAMRLSDRRDGERLVGSHRDLPPVVPK